MYHTIAVRLSCQSPFRFLVISVRKKSGYREQSSRGQDRLEAVPKEFASLGSTVEARLCETVHVREGSC